jgi:WD40 repeat protein
LVSPKGKYVAVRFPESAVIFATADGSFLKELEFDVPALQRAAQLERHSLASKIDASLRHISSVAFSHDDQFSVATSSQGDRLVWKLGTATVTQFVERDEGCSGNDSTSTSPDGYAVASDANKGRGLCTWRIDDPEFSETQKFSRVERDTGVIYVGTKVLIFSHSGEHVVSASKTEDHSLRLWNLSSREQFLLAGHRGPINDAVFSPDDKTLVSASSDKTVRIWQIEEMGRLELRGPSGLSTWPGVRFGTRHPIAISPDGLHVAYASGGNAYEGQDDRVPVSTPTENRFELLGGWRGWVGSAAFTQGGRELIVSSTEPKKMQRGYRATSSEISIVDLASKNVQLLDTLQEPYADIDASGDGRWVVASGKRVILWNRASHDRMDLTDRVPCNGSSSAYFAGEAPTLAVVCGQIVRLLRLPELVLREKDVSRKVKRFAIAPSGTRFAIADDQRIEVWDASERIQQLAVLEGHEAEVVTLTFSADGSLLASSANDSVRIWDVIAGRGRRLDAPVFEPTVLRFAPNQQAIIGAGDTHFYLWWDSLPTKAAQLRAHIQSLRAGMLPSHK